MATSDLRSKGGFLGMEREKVWTIIFRFKGVIFRFHVSFRAGYVLLGYMPQQLAAKGSLKSGGHHLQECHAMVKNNMCKFQSDNFF